MPVIDDFESGSVDSGWTTSNLPGSWTAEPTIELDSSRAGNYVGLLQSGDNDFSEIQYEFDSPTSNIESLQTDFALHNVHSEDYIRIDLLVRADGESPANGKLASIYGDGSTNFGATLDPSKDYILTYYNFDYQNNTLGIKVEDYSGNVVFDEPAAELRFTHDSYDAVSGIVFAAYAGATGRNTEGVYDNVQSVLTAAAPTNLTVSGGYRETTLSWDASANATGYRIYRSESSGSTLSDYTQIADISASTTSYTDTGLEDGERYYYRVTAYANSESDPSGEADAITDLPGPSTPTLDTSTDDEIAVSWTRSDNSGDGDHLIQRSQDNATWTNAGTTSATTTAYTDTGLEDGEQYYYRVRRRTAHATTTSGAATGTTVLPAPSISFDTSTQREITVSWTQTDDNPAGDWELYRSTDGSLGTLVGSWSDLSTTTYTDTGLPDGERYHYTVRRATNHATADTQEAAVTVLPAPTNHQYSTVTAVGADHSWTNNHNNGTVKIQARHDDSGWQDVVSGLDRSTETYTIASLLHGEQYDVRVVAVTEHAQTEDQ